MASIRNRMHVLCAPDSFKGTLTAAEAALAMARGVRAAGNGNEADVCPVADGGEGTLDALMAAMGGTIHRARVKGPLGDDVEARFGVAAQGDRRVAVVELAEASGLTLVPQDRRDPTRTTTYGTGQVIGHAVRHGVDEVLVCLGGSATVDGGSGLAQALGARFFDDAGREIRQAMCGGLLPQVRAVTPPPPLPPIRAACDVTSPLCGPRGAAAVYGPQKGATPQQVVILDAALRHFAAVVGGDPDQPGTGAAGGATFGLVHLCGASIERGIDLVLNAVDFGARCRGAHLVLTGEGQLDGQSRFGKACMGVAARAAASGVPTVAIVGRKGSDWQQCVGSTLEGLIVQCVSLEEHFGQDLAMRNPAPLIEQLAADLVAARRPT